MTVSGAEAGLFESRRDRRSPQQRRAPSKRRAEYLLAGKITHSAQRASYHLDSSLSLRSPFFRKKKPITCSVNKYWAVLAGSCAYIDVSTTGDRWWLRLLHQDRRVYYTNGGFCSILDFVVNGPTPLLRRAFEKSVWDVSRH